MKLSHAQIEELRAMLARCADAPMTQRETKRLNELLASDVQAQQMFADYAMLDACLEMVWTSGEGREAGNSTIGDSAPLRQAVPVIIGTSPILHARVFPFQSPLGSLLFSYGAAAAIVAVGMLIGWACQVSLPQSDRQEVVVGPHSSATPLPQEPETVFVGRITGMVDCRWADPRKAPFGFDRVALGRKYALVSGLIEIVYDSGARVILQGPCDYEVESKIGGYLSLGRVTARVEKEGEGRGERGEGRRPSLGSRHSTIGNPSPLSALRSPLFFVRTPTATVADLGTEFGVEVDNSGASRAHVFRGKVEIRAAGNGSPKAVFLGENESARIDINRIASVVRETGQKLTFVREMPKSVPIQFFNTGRGLKKGDPDPHWQVVSRSDDPNFKPQPAVVVTPVPANGADNPSRSQWIAPTADAVLPDDVVFVFRTTFDLTGILPSRAALRGRFIADDFVTAIRLNGRKLKVPLQHEGEPFVYWSNFSANAGFVKGINVLEIDVLNADPYISPSRRHALKTQSPIYCIVELEGEGVCDPGLANSEAHQETSQAPSQKGKTSPDPKTPKQDVSGGKADPSEDAR